MKKTISTVIAIALLSATHAQIDLQGKIKNKLNDKANQKTDEAIDNGLNEVENDAKKTGTKKDKSKGSENTTKTEQDQGSSTASGKQDTGNRDLKSYSKFDFIAGDQVIYYEDFSQDAIGDFPAKWNTNASAEVVTLGNISGKWLKTANDAKYKPEINTNGFPDNYTLEFDLVFTAPNGIDMGSSFHSLAIDFYAAPNEQMLTSDANEGGSGTGARFVMNSGGNFFAQNWKDGENMMNNNQNKDLFSGKSGQVFRVSIWIQKQRGRIYINDVKVFDLPLFMPPGPKYNAISFATALPGDDEKNFLSNIRIAVGAPDMRNKLLTDGKLITRGITFDPGSDKIKAESYGTLKEIAQVLKDNAAVKVKIIGHTDSDGADAANLELSKKRAIAIKNALAKDFGIEDGRMQTDGKGETEPASPNNTPEGKANNRRVEFIKL